MAARELELKLELASASPRQITSWLHDRTQAPGVNQFLRTVYFDTPDFALRRAGISLRIRKMGDSHIQTVKLVEGAGSIDRPEWETSVSGFLPDFSAAQITGLKPFRSKQLAGLIQEVFETRVRRTIYAISGSGAVFELALDRGEVVANGRRARFSELEIELKQGDIHDIIRFGRSLGRIAPLRPGVLTKSDRGYALAHGEQPDVYRAESPNLRPKTQTSDAFRIIARDCLRQLGANVPATLKGSGEALHQMRVAVRRLQAAMSVFSDMIGDSEAPRLKAEFKWIMRILGAARDLDVLLDQTLKPRPNGHVKQGLPQIVRTFRAKRRQAYSVVSAALQSARFRNLILEVLAWVECGRWQRKLGALAIAQREQTIVTFAARELHRRCGKLKKTSADFMTLDQAARHAVRIRAKKLRYAVEFFGGVFPGKKNAERHADLLRALKELQSTLGDLNDIATHEHLMAGIALSGKAKRKAGAAESFRAGVIYRSEGARIAELLDAANSTSEKISTSKAFWA